jgi:ubiquinone/menaquinone biosynthesis C-methylase UbiE
LAPRKRSHRLDKLAQIYDDEILPVWAERFGRMLLRDLTIPPKAQILDVACGTGYPAVELIRRMGPDARLIAIDPISAMLDVARKKVEAMKARGVFFRTESAEPKLSFADFARVTKPGGQVRCTVPLAGTFQEFYDIYREVLTKHDKHDTLDLLNRHVDRYATVERATEWMEAAPLADARVEVEEFSLLFRSSREFFFAPVIEFGPLPAWKRVAGPGQQMQDVFWYIKEAIDAYFGGRAFEVTVIAGCLIGTVPSPEHAGVTSPVELVDLDSEIELSTGDVAEVLADELDTIERGEPVSRQPTPPPASDSDVIDIRAPDPIEEAEAIEIDFVDVDSVADVPLDAFAEGAERPEHLDPADDTTESE